MHPYSCNFCHYSSAYKHNYERHLKIHNRGSEEENNQPRNNHPRNNQPKNNHARNDYHQQQQVHNVSGYPVQALNLANNIQIPPPSTTNQIINIQPPNPPIVKKPVLHGYNHKYFDIRLKENFKVFISGPSRSGKTVFVQDLVRNLKDFTHLEQ